MYYASLVSSHAVWTLGGPGSCSYLYLRAYCAQFASISLHYFLESGMIAPPPTCHLVTSATCHLPYLPATRHTCLLPYLPTAWIPCHLALLFLEQLDFTSLQPDLPSSWYSW